VEQSLRTLCSTVKCLNVALSLFLRVESCPCLAAVQEPYEKLEIYTPERPDIVRTGCFSTRRGFGWQVRWIFSLFVALTSTSTQSIQVSFSFIVSAALIGELERRRDIDVTVLEDKNVRRLDIVCEMEEPCTPNGSLCLLP
jgi:hypothetical protein